MASIKAINIILIIILIIIFCCCTGACWCILNKREFLKVAKRKITLYYHVKDPECGDKTVGKLTRMFNKLQREYTEDGFVWAKKLTPGKLSRCVYVRAEEGDRVARTVYSTYDELEGFYRGFVAGKYGSVEKTSPDDSFEKPEVMRVKAKIR